MTWKTLAQRDMFLPRKGQRVRVRAVLSLPSLAGVQLKGTVSYLPVEGTVESLHGDHPRRPKTIGIVIKDDAGRTHEYKMSVEELALVLEVKEDEA